MNLTLHAQTEGVNRDNWQIPWWNEMLRTLKVTSVFAFCLAKESQHFWCIASPLHKNTFFLSGEFLPNFPDNNSNIGKLAWSMTCWHFIWRNQSKRVHEMCQMKLLKSKVWWECFWNIYHINEIYESATQITGELIKIFFLALLVRGNTQGKLLLSARLVLFSGALMWKI